MKDAEVEVGGRYSAVVCGRLVDVRVQAAWRVRSYGPRSREHLMFRLVRCDSGKSLPKARRAAALRRLALTREEERAAGSIALGMRLLTAQGPALYASVVLVRAMRALSGGAS